MADAELRREFEKWRDNTWRTVKDSEWLAYKAGAEAGERKERERCAAKYEHAIECINPHFELCCKDRLSLRLRIKQEAGAQDSEETACPSRPDGMHCNCWYDGQPCCDCGDGRGQDRRTPEKVKEERDAGIIRDPANGWAIRSD